MKKRWVSLYVENDVGVLAKIAGLFSGKCYNLESLTVGTTEDETISRMTIGLNSDDMTFEQIIKQLNRCVEVIKVIDITDAHVLRKELMFVKVEYEMSDDLGELITIVNDYHGKIVDIKNEERLIIIQSVQSEKQNDKIITDIKKKFSKIEVVRGGSVAV